MASANIHDYIAPGRRAHLVGIGGVSMSPLAEVLHKAGMVITGSDMRICAPWASPWPSATGGRTSRGRSW